MPKNRFCFLSVISLFFTLPQPGLSADDAPENHEPPTCKYCPDLTGWSGSIEAGLGYQGEDDFRFGRYSGDYEQGAFLDINGGFNYLDEAGVFVEGTIEDLGRDASYLKIQGGRQGKFEAGFEFDQVPNYREDSAFSPYQQTSGSGLSLPDDWISGATTQNMPGLADSLQRTPWTTERERSTANFAYYPAQNWKISAFIRHEEKQGVKDFGASFGFNQAVILPLPIDYVSDDFSVTLDYTNDEFQSQVNLTSSLFSNEKNAFNWQNPYQDVISDTAFGQSTADSPDNESHQISAILGYQFSDSTRVSARLASGRMKQNEAFVPYTINPSVATTSLPVDSLNGEIDTTLASVQINSRPVAKLRVDASYSYSDRDNKTAINSYDIVTTDLAIGGTRINRPYSYQQNLLRLKARYRLPHGMNLSGGYDDDQMDRDYTSVEETHDKTVWFKFGSRPLDSVETTLKYSYSKRDTSAYRALADINPLLDFPNSNFYNNELLRIHNMADRKRDKLGFEVSYMPVTEVSLGLDLDYVRDEFDEMFLGLQQARGVIYSASISYYVSEALTTSLYFSHDKLTSDQKGSEKQLASDADNIWVESDSSLTRTLGIGMNWIMIEEKLDIDADLTWSEFSGEVNYVNAVDLPELTSTLKALSVRGKYTLSDNLALGMEFRYESFEEDDWSKDGAVNGLPALLSLGTGVDDNSTSLLLVSLKYVF